MYCFRLVLQADVFLERAMHASSREDAIPSLEVQRHDSLVPSHHADSLIVHQTGGSQMPISSLSIPSTDQSTTLFFESEPT